MKIAVYTALFVDDDSKTFGGLHNYKHKKDGIDYIAFTNSDKIKSDFWDVRVNKELHRNGRRTARKYKILCHSYLNDYDVSIWIDNQYFHTYDVRSIVDCYLDGYDIVIHTHGDRDCLYDEGHINIRFGNDNPKIINSQLEDYSD